LKDIQVKNHPFITRGGGRVLLIKSPF